MARKLPPPRVSLNKYAALGSNIPPKVQDIIAHKAGVVDITKLSPYQKKQLEKARQARGQNRPSP